MESQIVDLGPLTLLGLEARFIAAMSPDAIRKRRPLSQELEGLLAELGLPALAPGRA